jgi:hypothetical protein
VPHSITYEATGGACIRYWGAVTIEEIAAVVRRGQALPSFTDRRYTIHDFTDIEHFYSEPRAVEGLAATDSGAALTNRRLQVLVVTSRPEIEQMVTAYCKVGVPVFPVRVFPSMQAARDWLASAPA